MIAALFVETDGCYFNQPGIDPWDIVRDARNYTGPHPVIAHPPCQLWGRFAHVNYSRWGGIHNHPGNDGGCFAFALAAVREFGGVLEHPAFSDAWSAYSLTEPANAGWQQCGETEWTCEVWQSAYGHKANKRTWLYYCGPRPMELRWERPVGTHQIGFHDQRGKTRNKPTISGKAASATPPGVSRYVNFYDTKLSAQRQDHRAGRRLRCIYLLGALYAKPRSPAIRR